MILLFRIQGGAGQRSAEGPTDLGLKSHEFHVKKEYLYRHWVCRLGWIRIPQKISLCTPGFSDDRGMGNL